MKRLQINGNFLQTGGEFPFKNCLKTAQGWSDNNTNTEFAPDRLDANGYPNDLAAGAAYRIFFIPMQEERLGRYVVRATGAGSMGLRVAQGSPTGSLTASGGSLRYEFLPSDGLDGNRIDLMVLTGSVGSGYLTDISFCHVDDEAAIVGGATADMFGGQFEERLTDAGCAVFRFLNWQASNGNGMSLRSHIAPVAACSYYGPLMVPNTFAGTATKAGSAYTATLSGFTLTDKAMVTVKWGAAGGTGDTLNISGTGAKPIKNYVGEAFYGWEAQCVANAYNTLIYDAALDCWLRNVESAGIARGVPIEVATALCNKLSISPWWIIPFMAVDPLTSYTADVATYFRDNLNAGLIPRIEPPNEFWNTAYGFGTNYFVQREIARGHADFGWDYAYGRALSKVGQAVSTVYSNDRTKYHVVCGCFTAIVAEERLTSTRYVAETGNAANAAKNWATIGAPASYFNIGRSGVAGRENDLLQAAYDYSVGDAAARAQLVSESALDTTIDIPSTGVKALLTNWYSMAITTHGLTGMEFYEGGPGLDKVLADFGGNISAITQASSAVVMLASGNTVVPPVGTSVAISGVGGMTGLNGNTYTVTANNVGTRQFTLSVNTTGMGAYTSGGYANFENSRILVNTFNIAVKFAPDMTTSVLRMYHACLEVGGRNPSAYNLGGEDDAWSANDPNIYAEPAQPIRVAMELFAQGKARLRLRGA